MTTIKSLRSPIIWVGGKGMSRRWILEHLAVYPHRIYVEPFGGGASVLLAKEPAPVDVYNDLNGGLVDFFRVLADSRQFGRFRRIVETLPYSRRLYYDYRNEWSTEKNPVVRAAKWFYVARQSFGGKFGNSWGYCVNSSDCGMNSCSSRWLSTIKMLPEIHAKLQRVQIESIPALEIIDKYDTPGTLFYLDPPYVMETRVGGKMYDYEMTLADHEALVANLLAIRGAACLSGYEHLVYRPLLKAGWTISRKEVSCRIVGRTRAKKDMSKDALKRTECLYMSPINTTSDCND